MVVKLVLTRYAEKLIKSFDNQLIYRAKIPNICWFQILKCKGLLVSSVLYNCKLNTFGFWTTDQTKKQSGKVTQGL